MTQTKKGFTRKGWQRLCDKDIFACVAPGFPGGNVKRGKTLIKNSDSRVGISDKNRKKPIGVIS